jgi:hypothetical protein
MAQHPLLCDEHEHTTTTIVPHIGNTSRDDDHLPQQVFFNIAIFYFYFGEAREGYTLATSTLTSFDLQPQGSIPNPCIEPVRVHNYMYFYCCYHRDMHDRRGSQLWDSEARRQTKKEITPIKFQ